MDTRRSGAHLQSGGHVYSYGKPVSTTAITAAAAHTIYTLFSNLVEFVTCSHPEDGTRSVSTDIC